MRQVVGERPRHGVEAEQLGGDPDVTVLFGATGDHDLEVATRVDEPTLCIGSEQEKQEGRRHYLTIFVSDQGMEDRRISSVKLRISKRSEFRRKKNNLAKNILKTYFEIKA